MGVNAKDAVLVEDDQNVDIRPAKQLGISTVLIDREGKIEFHIADFKVRNLIEMARIVLQ